MKQISNPAVNSPTDAYCSVWSTCAVGAAVEKEHHGNQDGEMKRAFGIHETPGDSLEGNKFQMAWSKLMILG